MLDLGRRRALRSSEAGAGAGAIEAAVFGLLGLLIAFTFSGAAGRFEDRRTLIVDEANAIGTFALRLDLLPAGTRAELRRELANYVSLRIATHRLRGDAEAEEKLWRESDRLQARVWALTLAAVRGPDAPAQSPGVLVNPLNESFDMAGKRKAAMGSHPPSVTFGLLAVLALCTSFLAGLNLGPSVRDPRLHMAVFAVTISVVFFVTRDMEHPREGLIRVDDADAPLVELRATLSDAPP
jgi:hypothetical protein